jgi:hypothetical protein
MGRRISASTQGGTTARDPEGIGIFDRLETELSRAAPGEMIPAPCSWMEIVRRRNIDGASFFETLTKIGITFSV